MLELDLALRRGDFDLALNFASPARALALFGPSGSGKTTLLMAIAGLRRPDAGRVVLDGRVLYDSAAAVDVPVMQRRLGVVFQDGRLFPHLSVRENLLFGREAGRFARLFGRAARRGARSPARARAPAHEGIAFDAAVQLLGLAPLLTRRPQALSGGEARRVAVGRALLSNPAALLLDEPLTGLHREARVEVLDYLRALRAELDLPIVLVSHQPDEVAALAQEVVRLDDGRVRERVGVEEFLRRHPT